MSEWLKETDCKSVGSAYVGSNPTSPTFEQITMNVSAIKTAKQLMKVMDRMDPLEKRGVLVLQAMYNEGKGDIVEQYKKMFQKEYGE